MKTVREDIMRLAHGKWVGILSHFGLDEKAVSGKHGPCPMCGGKDRFRLISPNNGARWICNQCGSGDGMDLLQMILKCDFKSAAKRLRPIVSGVASAPPKRGPSKTERKKRLMKDIEAWKAATANHDTLGEYFESRGLRPDEYIGGDYRLHYTYPLYDDDGKHVRNMPCLLSRISTRDGKMAALHRTYLFENGDGTFKTKKKITPPSREWRGGAIRMFSTKDSTQLLVAEGIETALSARAIIMRRHKLAIPAWAAVSANNLENIAIPPHITQVMVAGDNDLSFTGQKAAFVLANRLTVHDKRKVQVVMPMGQGDFNDEIQRGIYD